MWKAEGVLTDIQFGWSLDQLYLRLDPDEQSQTRQVGLTVELQLQTPAQLYQLSFSLAPSESDQFLLSQKLASGVLAGDRPLPIDQSSKYCRTGRAVQGLTAYTWAGTPHDHSDSGTSIGSSTLPAVQARDFSRARSGV